jgi:hypothetical protein
MNSDSEEESGDDLFMNDIFQIDADYAKFKNLVKKKMEYREILEIKRDLGPKKVSTVWKYFGSLHFRTKKVYKDKVFCIPCLNVQNFMLKA